MTVAQGSRTVHVSGQDSPEVMQALVEASAVVFGTPPPRTAITLIGVAALADPAYKIEIEATAVLP